MNGGCCLVLSLIKKNLIRFMNKSKTESVFVEAFFCVMHVVLISKNRCYGCKI